MLECFQGTLCGHETALGQNLRYTQRLLHVKDNVTIEIMRQVDHRVCVVTLFLAICVLELQRIGSTRAPSRAWFTNIRNRFFRRGRDLPMDTDIAQSESSYPQDIRCCRRTGPNMCSGSNLVCTHWCSHRLATVSFACNVLRNPKDHFNTITAVIWSMFQKFQSLPSEHIIFARQHVSFRISRLVQFHAQQWSLVNHHTDWLRFNLDRRIHHTCGPIPVRVQRRSIPSP